VDGHAGSPHKKQTKTEQKDEHTTSGATRRCQHSGTLQGVGHVKCYQTRKRQISRQPELSNVTRIAKIQGYFITSWWAVIYDVPKVHSKIKKPLPVALGW
jgi:hypothetical protein